MTVRTKLYKHANANHMDILLYQHNMYFDELSVRKSFTKRNTAEILAFNFSQKISLITKIQIGFVVLAFCLKNECLKIKVYK